MYKKIFEKISEQMNENKDYLIELDAKFGDGDLGLSMEKGFLSIKKFVENQNETDLGKFFKNISIVFNENAPSSLGTIISFGFMGMAKSLKGESKLSLKKFVKAYEEAIINIENKCESKKGDKTILDSMYECLEIMKINLNEGFSNMEFFKYASNAAKIGAENTKKLIAKHGRASYHKEKTLGFIDGGAYVNYLIFKGIYESFK